MERGGRERVGGKETGRMRQREEKGRRGWEGMDSSGWRNCEAEEREK